MKHLLLALLALASFSVRAADDFAIAFCGEAGTTCDGEVHGAPCSAPDGSAGRCAPAPATAGDFCLCRSTAPAEPPADPCDRRPLPRHCR